jgi:hypothetical protein
MPFHARVTPATPLPPLHFGHNPTGFFLAVVVTQIVGWKSNSTFAKRPHKQTTTFGRNTTTSTSTFPNNQNNLEPQLNELEPNLNLEPN